MGAEEIQAIVDGTKELKEYQDTPSPKEDLEKIPLLKRSRDIRKEAEKFILTEREIGGTKVLAHELFTSGIGYLRVMFRTDRVPSRDLPYVGLLKAVLGFVDTTKHTYSDLSDEINFKYRRYHAQRQLLCGQPETGRVYRYFYRECSGAVREAGLRIFSDRGDSA
ncbi:MAG: hypothetical protein ACLR8P_11890 [Clostridium fessum]